MRYSPLCAVLAGVVFLSACASSSSRQQRAYQKYVRDSRAGRDRQRAFFKSKTPEIPGSTASDRSPVFSGGADAESGPQSIPREDAIKP